MFCLEIHELLLRGVGGTQRPQALELDGGMASACHTALDGGKRVYGNAARAQARWSPTESCGGLWSRLDRPDEALRPRIAETNRDAAGKHLSVALPALEGAQTPGCALTPSSMNETARTQVREIFSKQGLNNLALLDTSIAACLAHRGALGQASQALVADLGWDRGAVTLLDCPDDHLAVNTVLTFEPGFREMEIALMAELDELIVKQTRLRPSRKGATEQALYDQLPGLLANLLQQPQASVEISGKPAAIERAALLSAATPVIQALTAKLREALEQCNAPFVPLILDDQLALAPGLREHLARLPELTPIWPPTPHDRASAGFRWLAENQDAPLESVNPRAIEWGPSEREPDAAYAPPESGRGCFHTGVGGFLDGAVPEPTHLIFQGRALPLDGRPFMIGRTIPSDKPGLRIDHPLDEVAAEHCELRRSLSGGLEVAPIDDAVTWRNDERLTGPKELQPGDYLGIGGNRVVVLLACLVTEGDRE